MSLDASSEQYIQPIPTTYSHTNFRSRLEARWAVFVDLLSIPYEYEPEKHFTGMSRYIPDFRVKNFCSLDGLDFIEIKGKTPDMVALERASAVNAVVFSGPLVAHSISKPITDSSGALIVVPLYLRQCPFCRTVGLARLGTENYARELRPSNHPDCDSFDFIEEHLGLRPGWDRDLPISRVPKVFSPIVQIALERAHNVRFEDPNLYERLQDFKATLARLSELGAFSDSLHVAGIFLRAIEHESCKFKEVTTLSTNIPTEKHMEAGT